MVRTSAGRTTGLRIHLQAATPSLHILTFGSLACPRSEEMTNAQAMTLLADLAAALGFSITPALSNAPTRRGTANAR